MSLLRFSPGAPEDLLRAAIVETGRIAYERGLIMSNDGNISVRMADNTILITPAGLCKGRLSPGDLLVVSMEGKILRHADDPALRVSSEQPMHLEAYHQRPDIRAVLHAHPPYATALTVAGRDIRSDLLPEVLMALGDVPITGLAVPSSEEDAVLIRSLICKHDALVLRQHGSLSVGKNLDEALIHLERLEHAAHVQAIAEMIGQLTPLPLPLLKRMRDFHY
jgi:L-fuculose-phosphate aldolase